MGNWRTVNIFGTISEDEVPLLQERLSYSLDSNENVENFTPLSYEPGRPSMFGLDEWPDTYVSAKGNLAERDYTVEDVAKTLRELVTIAPSMKLNVHCGGENESKICVATIVVSNSKVTVDPPLTDIVYPVSTNEMRQRMLGYFQ